MKVKPKIQLFAINLGKPVNSKWNSKKYIIVGVRLPCFVLIAREDNMNDEFELHMDEIELEK